MINVVKKLFVVLVLSFCLPTSLALACNIKGYERLLSVALKIDQTVIMSINRSVVEILTLELNLPEKTRLDYADKLSLATNGFYAANQGVLELVVTECGWPDPKRFTSEARAGAFAILQHSEIDYQTKLEPAVKLAFERGEFSGSAWATFQDRLANSRGQPQIYGTQISGTVPTSPGEKTKIIWNVVDRANLDARRKTVGLDPICAQFARMKEAAELFKENCR
jgi:hypothetical protein